MFAFSEGVEISLMDLTAFQKNTIERVRGRGGGGKITEGEKGTESKNNICRITPATCKNNKNLPLNNSLFSGTKG